MSFPILIVNAIDHKNNHHSSGMHLPRSFPAVTPGIMYSFLTQTSIHLISGQARPSLLQPPTSKHSPWLLLKLPEVLLCVWSPQDTSMLS